MASTGAGSLLLHIKWIKGAKDQGSEELRAIVFYFLNGGGKPRRYQRGLPTPVII